MNRNPKPPVVEVEASPVARRGLRLLDLVALIVGYSLAALLIKAFWPASATGSFFVAAGLAIEYVWLGLAMSGPFVLLLDRRRQPQSDLHAPRRRRRLGQPIGAVLEPAPRDPPARYTGAELAWLLIGGYWIGLTIMVVPAKLPRASAPLLGLLPFLVAAVLSLIGPKRPRAERGGPAWTHRTAVILLLLWPIAWIALIALTQLL
jgi:hypothetical protein